MTKMTGAFLVAVLGMSSGLALADDRPESACQMNFERLNPKATEAPALLRVEYLNEACGDGPAYYQFAGGPYHYIVFHQDDLFLADFYAPAGTTTTVTARSDEGNAAVAMVITFPEN